MQKPAPATPSTTAVKRRRAAAAALPPEAQALGGRDGREPAPDRDQAVRLAAYRLYEARGCVDGHALEDWLQAEAQVAAERERPAAS